MFKDSETQTFIKTPLSLKFIFICRHLLNTQNLFTVWESLSLARLHKKYSTYPEGHTVELTKINWEDFNLTEFEAAGNNIRPFIIKGFRTTNDLDWNTLKSEYGNSMVPTHPDAVINENFTYQRADYTNLKETIERMEQDDPSYVIGCSQVFKDHPQLSKMFSAEKIENRFDQKVIRRELFIGGPKVGSSFHCAGGDNFFLMVSGHKKWIFVSPRNYIAMYPTYGRDRESYVLTSEINSLTYEDAQKDRFPLFSKVTKYTVTLEPGDLLFNPSMWWHEVHNLDRTIGVPHRALSQGRRRYELPSWLNLAKTGAVKYIFSSAFGVFTGKSAQVDTTDKMIINTYGGSPKRKRIQ